MNKSARWSQTIGSACIGIALFILFFTYYPLLWEELRYFLARGESKPVLSREEAQGKESESLIPRDETFGIVVPKIGANSRVIPEVAWEDYGAYQSALREGVAHAAGTGKPGEGSTIFLFAHSGVDFYEVARYNAVFSLLGKLEPEDPIYLFSLGRKHEYRVLESRVVSAGDTSFLTEPSSEERLILMTCWPIGTTWKRLVVIATPTSL